ncbi:MAG TPA: hypothetical protein VHU17_01265 [Acidimicrobiales bacterium]|nr:hypothetical protein [Acidimicrobiales bacterium]
MSTGPICHLCGAVVPTVSWVTLDEETKADADQVAATGTESSETNDATEPMPTQAGPRPPREVGLCPDCLAAARARGRLLAPVIPLRPGARRRRRRTSD